MANKKKKSKKKSKKKVVHKGRIALVLGVLIVLVIGSAFVIPHIMKSGYHNDKSFETFASNIIVKDKTHKVGNSEAVYEYGKPCSYAYDLPVTDYPNFNEKVQKKWDAAKEGFHLAGINAMEGDQLALMTGYESFETPYDCVSLAVHTYRYEKNKDGTTLEETVDPYIVSTKTGTILPAIAVFSGDYESIYTAAAKEFLESKYKDSLTENYEAQIKASAKKFIINNDGITFYFDAGTVANADQGAIALEMKYSDFEGIVRDDIGKRVVDPSQPMVAITYDDGPSAETTPELLDLYEKYGVVCTFFELGQLVDNTKGADKILKRELDLGCEVGTHSYSHANLYELSTDALKEDAKKSKAAIKNATGQEPTIFRPPYGNGSQEICDIFGLPGINWNVDTLDWQSKNADAVISHVLNGRNLDGDIILMHSIYPSTVEASKKIVPELIDQGYQLVTVSELLEYKYGYSPIPKKKYFGYQFGGKDE